MSTPALRDHGESRSLPAPADFVRVAVISPETSAGLGDFRQEADRLHGAGLCEFLFLRATFQGPAAASSLLEALETALTAHRERPFDALVIIRGGGAVTDLAWLNDLELARCACRLPIPILTGIGHERDSTILDEVAHRRFDTPSKAAHHTTQVIRDNALAALADLERIGHQVRRILVRDGDRLAVERQRIEAQVRLGLARAEAGVGGWAARSAWDPPIGSSRRASRWAGPRSGSASGPGGPSSGPRPISPGPGIRSSRPPGSGSSGRRRRSTGWPRRWR